MNIAGALFGGIFHERIGEMWMDRQSVACPAGIGPFGNGHVVGIAQVGLAGSAGAHGKDRIAADAQHADMAHDVVSIFGADPDQGLVGGDAG